MKEYLHKIQEGIKKHYGDVEHVSGQNLHELGEWIDICKDIAECWYYQTSAIRNEAVIDAMEEKEHRTMDTVVNGFEEAISELAPGLSAEEIKKYKMRLSKIASEL